MVDLSHIPLFSKISEKSQSLITLDLFRYYCHGQVLMREGERGNSLIVLVRGQARVTRDGVFLVQRTVGSVVGEQALIDGADRTATVTADGTVEAIEIRSDIFDQLLGDANFARNMMRILSAKLGESTNHRAFRYRVEERLFAAFSAHLAPEITDRLLRSGDAYGEPKYVDAAILMADVRSFTEKCVGMEPAEIARDLGAYLDAMVAIVHEHHGFVDKFVGDAVLAVWGITPAQCEPTAGALACARAMVLTAAGLKFGADPIRIGVGLNFGPVFVGNIGGPGKRQFTVLGSPVNMAQRYESETKVLGVDIVAGEAFYEALPEEEQRAWIPFTRPIKGAGPQVIYGRAVEGARLESLARGAGP